MRNAMLIEEARSKIRTTQLLNRLQDHGLGKIELTQTQVRAIEILLKKIVPDVSAHTVQGHIAHDHAFAAEPISATARWLEELVGGGAQGEMPKPLPN